MSLDTKLMATLKDLAGMREDKSLSTVMIQYGMILKSEKDEDKALERLKRLYEIKFKSYGRDKEDTLPSV